MSRGLFTASLALAAVVAIWIPSQQASAAGSEERCLELGAECTCSEPLDVNQSFSGSRFQNPKDTTTKECAGEQGNGNAVTLPLVNNVVLGNVVRASSLGGNFPSGADPLVWGMQCQGIHHIQADTIYGLDEGTTCIRGYQRYSPDLRAPASVGTNQERVKIQGLGGGFTQGTFTVGSEIDPFGSGGLALKFISTQYNVDKGTLFPDVVGKCKSHWCRFESCVDQIGNRITMRFRWNVVGTSEVHTDQITSGSGPAVLQDLNYPQSAILFCQGNMTGTQYSSHNMQATIHPADSSFWIGPAYELEGGSGSPAPPAEASPPAPPILLGD